MSQNGRAFNDSRKRPYEATLQSEQRQDRSAAAGLADRRLARTERRRGVDEISQESSTPNNQHSNGSGPSASLSDVRSAPLAAAAVANTDDEIADVTYEIEDEEAERQRLQEQRKRRRAMLESLETVGEGSGGKIGQIQSQSNVSSLMPSTTASREHSTPADEGLDEGDFELSKPQDSSSAPVALDSSSRDGQIEASASDYDPSKDPTIEEERLRAQRRQAGSSAVPSTSNHIADGIGEPRTQGESRAIVQARLDDGGDSEYEEVDVDAEDSDEDDMFAINVEKAPKKKLVRVKKQAAGSQIPSNGRSNEIVTNTGLADNWDDAEGYYRIILGERIGERGRYHVFANLGKGMFSEVIRAKDLESVGKDAKHTEVAIKIVRRQETMYKAGQQEIAILEKLMAMDPDDKRHVVRLLSHFDHKGHLCMVFESLSMNLRDVVKRFGKDVGLNLRAVRAYAHQMFLALALLRKAEIIHADIKPDNILINEAKTTLKICDLGSASDLTKMEITPYLVSRFYRAPEIILGQASFDCSLDTWSIGCTLYELFTGKILFPGRSNNQMLLLIQELKGKFTTRQIRKGKFSDQHFDESNTFLSQEKDKQTGADIVRKMNLSTTPSQDLRSRLLSPQQVKGIPEDELRLTQNFVDLVNRTLELDPAKRITPNDALKHPFLA